MAIRTALLAHGHAAISMWHVSRIAYTGEITVWLHVLDMGVRTKPSIYLQVLGGAHGSSSNVLLVPEMIMANCLTGWNEPRRHLPTCMLVAVVD